MLSRKEADGWQLAVFSDLGNLPVHPVAARARIMVVSVPHRCGQRARIVTVCVIVERLSMVCVHGKISGAGP